MPDFEAFVNTFPWVKNSDIPWAPMKKRLAKSIVGIVSTGGVYVDGDQPFAIANAQDVDETYREISAETSIGKLRLAHEHYDKSYARQDVNVVFPIDRMRSLEQDGSIGVVAPVNFSITGYIPCPQRLYATGQAIARRLQELRVDAVLLVPV